MRPTFFLVCITGIWTLSAIAPAYVGELHRYWLYASGFILAVCLYDLLALLLKPTLSAQRIINQSLPLGVWSPIKIKLENQSKQHLHFDLYDHYPTHSEVRHMPRTSLHIQGGKEITIPYEINPQERGIAKFSDLQIRTHSPFRLWTRQRRIHIPQEVHVYPNFAAVAKYALLATDNKLHLMGVKKRRRRGEGMEFHQLREFRDGDSLRQIDWKATSRLKKIISREYQEESDQNVVFLLDCGYRMLSKDEDLSHFDHTLNALLLLAYVALRQGDSVGLQTFSGKNDKWFPPKKGSHFINQILSSVFDLQASHSPPDYSYAATQLLTKQKRRALVILLTNLRDDETHDLLPAIHLLKNRHLVLVASLQEQIINQTLEREVRTFNDALQHSASHLYLSQRNQALESLMGQGILYMDVEPSQLAINLVNRYLDIKQSGRL